MTRKRLDMFVFLSAASLLGVLFGTLIYCYAGDATREMLTNIREDFLESRLGCDFGTMLIKSFGTGLLFMLAVYLLGLCALGQPFTVLVLIYRAVGIGAAAASIFSVYGKEGIRVFSFLLLPEGAAGLMILILLCRESITMSGIVFKTLTADTGGRHLPDITKLYSVKALILLSCMGAAALLQSLLVTAYRALA